MHPALVGGRHLIRLGLGLEGVDQPDLIDRFGKPRHIGPRGQNQWQLLSQEV
jgi:hypothetical protein